MKSKTHVYAILRYDGFQDETVPITEKICVVKILKSMEQVILETERLNSICSKSVIYFWQITRLINE